MKKILFLLAIPLTFSVTSCKKAGCTDPIASNYSDAAKKDDGSCAYSEKLIFWQDMAAASSWSGLGVNNLKFYVNGQYIGSCLATEYMTGQPDCSQNAQSSYTIDFGKNKTATVQIKVTDESDYVWYEEPITVSAGSCNFYQVY